MKKLLMLMALLSSGGAAVNAQDVIIKKNGDEIKAKVQKITETEIEYSKWSNLNGPKYTISIGNVFMVKYENGEKDVFNQAQTEKKEESASDDGQPKLVEKAPASNNAELIGRHNESVEVDFGGKEKDKPAVTTVPILGMSNSSVLSTDELEMKFVPKLVVNKGSGLRWFMYYIELTNKTNSTIYIDKANCFKIDYANKATSYFDNKQINVSKGSSTGGGINLGGITGALGIGGVVGTLAGSTTVGGSSMGSVTTTYNQQRIITIPPHSMAYLSEFEQAHVKGSNYEQISDGEYWKIPSGLLRRGVVKRYGKVSYTEENSPFTYSYVITYSTKQDFSTYSNLNAKIFMKELYGTGCGTLTLEYYTHALKMTDNGSLKRLKETFPNFDLNKNFIIGRDSYLAK